MATVKRVKGEGYHQLEVALRNMDGKVGKVGWFENSRYDNVTSKHGPRQPTPVAQVAAVQEFGYGHIPPRPFFRPTIVRYQKTWANWSERGARAILKGTQTIGTVMDGIVQLAAGNVRGTIDQLWTPPLSRSTIMARIYARKIKKGDVTVSLTKPLIDTGIMYGTLIGKVEDE